METIVAANDQVSANDIRDALARVLQGGASCRIVSHESALLSVQDCPPTSPLLVFFVSSVFGDEHIGLLRQICREARGRATVVAVSPNYDPNILLKVVRCGAADYLNLNATLESDLANLVDRIRTTHEQSAPAGKVISVVGAVGGSGVSLLAVNLAVLFAQQEGTCGLLDLHLRGGDLARLLRLTPRFNLASLAGKSSIDATLFGHSVANHASGVRLLASPEPFSDFRQITAQLVQRIAQCARATCPHVFIDLEDVQHHEQLQILMASDQIVIPLRPDLVALYRTLRFLEYLSQAKINAERITIVANRVGQPKELSTQRMSEVLGVPIRHEIPDDPAAVNASFNLGIPLVVNSPRAAATLRLRSLQQWLKSPETRSKDDSRASHWLTRAALQLATFKRKTTASTEEPVPKEVTT